MPKLLLEKNCISRPQSEYYLTATELVIISRLLKSAQN